MREGQRMKLSDEIDHLGRLVFEGNAKTPPALRRAAAAHARFLAGLGPPDPALPGEWLTYVEKVALHAYKVTDEDVEMLRQAGHSEDEIFEITVATAVGASFARAEAGLRLLEEGV